VFADRSTQVVTRMLVEKPDLLVDPGNLPATARELLDVLAASGRFFDRGVPVKIVPDSHGGRTKSPPRSPHILTEAAAARRKKTDQSLAPSSLADEGALQRPRHKRSPPCLFGGSHHAARCCGHYARPQRAL
jgi:hypothetical protein